MLLRRDISSSGNPGRAELGRQYDHSWTQAGVDAERWSRAASQRWQRKSAAQSFGTARKRLMWTRMSGGVGAGRSILPATQLNLERFIICLRAPSDRARNENTSGRQRNEPRQESELNRGQRY